MELSSPELYLSLFESFSNPSFYSNDINDSSGCWKGSKDDELNFGEKM